MSNLNAQATRQSQPFAHEGTRLIQRGRSAERPLFSVIVNNYNYERYLVAALDSIAAQTCDDYELIIVDDGSSDSSLDIARRYTNATIISTNRLNQARACLEAVRHSRGSYIYILDADDVAEPELLASVARVLSRQPIKVQFQLRLIDADGVMTGDPFPPYPDDYTSADMRRDIEAAGHYRTPQTSANVFSRRVFDVIEDIDYEVAIDGITLLVSPFLGEVVSLNEPLVQYRLHGSNKSRAETATRYKVELTRFIGRLLHLERICGQLSIPIRLTRRPHDMFFVKDRSLMAQLYSGVTPGLSDMSAFLKAAYRERPLRSSVKLTGWLLGSVYGPARIRAVFADIHGNAWSPLRDRRNFLRAIIGQDDVKPLPHANVSRDTV